MTCEQGIFSSEKKNREHKDKPGVCQQNRKAEKNERDDDENNGPAKVRLRDRLCNTADENKISMANNKRTQSRKILQDTHTPCKEANHHTSASVKDSTPSL